MNEMNQHLKVSSICYGNNIRPKQYRKLYSHSIKSGKGSFIDESVLLKLKGCGICWCELEIINVGNSDCTLGTIIITSTDCVLSSYDIDGYDTCKCCHGEGVIKHGFK